ncbi:MAG: lycopene cyclase family protein [Flavobacteriaceae bacterium]|nr:lycopene cyclase family protein [Flavobacteriaceae bacterium]MDH3796914.1 lycopene cyclase family protein [Flavobacteriaceae bacterium]
MVDEQYDYIIIGAGAAGLMLASAMDQDPFFASKKVLLLEKQTQRSNDRTWSYWEKGSGLFDSLLNKQWHKIRFKGTKEELVKDIDPYSYKMLRGQDFYFYHYQKLNESTLVTLRHEAVVKVDEKENEVVVKTDRHTYAGGYVFNSLFTPPSPEEQKRYPLIQQHFVGWFIQAKMPVFEKDVATFMDFSIAQKGNTRFMYVLPFSQTEGLVEYTLFSKDLLENSEYEAAIKKYISEDLGCPAFEILEKEKGSIPMTAYDFYKRNTRRICYIGSAGGWTKPSTGFTFSNTMKMTQKVLRLLRAGSSFSKLKAHGRHQFYDSLLLDILARKNQFGRSVFEAMFQKRSPQLILAFLEERTTFCQELRIIWACPKRPFLTALIKRLFS